MIVTPAAAIAALGRGPITKKESAMCPACLTAMGLYVAGGVSAGAGTTFLATRLLRKQRESNASTPSTETQGENHARTDDRIEK